MIQIRVCKKFGFPILQVGGELTPTTALTLLQAIREVCGQKPRTLGLDLSGVTEYDSTSNFVLDSAAQWLERDQGRLRILGMSKAVRCSLQRTA
ncbi:STAS domain-containing protein [bacterium]|nr:STAS domain-containing protein [bacterium]